MARIEFLMKLCPVGRVLLEGFDYDHITLDERGQIFDETGSYETPEEKHYNQHVESCLICKEVIWKRYKKSE